jgi:hypothetical protein
MGVVVIGVRHDGPFFPQTANGFLQILNALLQISVGLTRPRVLSARNLPADEQPTCEKRDEADG